MRVTSCAVLALSLLAACSGGRLKREAASALTAADGAVLEGCHDCLIRARDAYAQLATSKYVNKDTIALRRFETELLLTVRARELQLDWRPHFSAARSLTPAVPLSIDVVRLLSIVDAVVPDGTGRVGDWPKGFRLQRRTTDEKHREQLQWLSEAPLRSAVRDYLSLALDCSWDARVLAPRPQPGATQRRPVLQPGASPLVIYGTGICLTPDTNMLAAALATVPAFAEAAYFGGTAAAFTAEFDGGIRAKQLLDQAYARFANAPGVTFVSGWLAMELGDCPTALRFFDETVASDSTHEMALLQGAICLSRTQQDSAVIARTSRLLSLAIETRQQAYYWRALSRFRLKDVAAARADIESAKSLERNATALTLGGIIENEQNDLAIAERDLREARALPRGEQNCSAAWTLGQVLAKSDRSLETAGVFEAASGCYDIAATVLRARMAALLSRPTRNPAYREKRIAGMAADTLEQRSRQRMAAFNAAGYYANAGDFAKALSLAALAESDSALTGRVEELRKAISERRQGPQSRRPRSPRTRTTT